MTKSIIKIIIYKHSKLFFEKCLTKVSLNKRLPDNSQRNPNRACLAQSVEHSAVNRSVGGPSPSTGAKETKQFVSFFVLQNACCTHTACGFLKARANCCEYTFNGGRYDCEGESIHQSSLFRNVKRNW